LQRLDEVGSQDFDPARHLRNVLLDGSVRGRALDALAGLVVTQLGLILTQI
jgi:hypothetical protein